MTYFYPYGLAFLELSFLLVAIMLLHSLKGVIGNAAFYMALGTSMTLAQILNATGMSIITGLPGMDFAITPAVFFAPFMAALLITYIVDGTLEAQRLIWALILGFFGIFTYLTFIADRQLLLSGYTLYPDTPDILVRNILFSSRIYVLASLLSVMIEFLTLPIVYQILRNRGCGTTVCISGALIFTQVLDAFFYELVTNYNWENWWEALRQSYVARACAMVWVSALTTVYLRLRRTSADQAGVARGPLDIVVAVLGGYGRARQLQRYVREWEGRYRLVVESTHDLIFLLDPAGTILDANPPALRQTGATLAELHQRPISALLEDEGGSSVVWDTVWESLSSEDAGNSRPRSMLQQQWLLRQVNGEILNVDVVVTPIRLQGRAAALVVARDVTARRALEAERQALQSQLFHAQRMEAVGKLAGGIAHDFNNLLHAIQGSLEMLDRCLSDRRRARQLISNIRVAAERAVTLTRQLLGFAREGKYQVEDIDVAELVQQTADLFEPMLDSDMTFKLVVHPDPMTVAGDFTQLQQVLLNMLLNAKEALEEVDRPRRVVLRAEPATRFTPGAEASDGSSVAEQVAIRVQDNGSGIPETVRERIFEPFFTTRETRGTGMGLAMAYGCIASHHGRIHVESTPGEGSEFVIYLPRT